MTLSSSSSEPTKIIVAYVRTSAHFEIKSSTSNPEGGLMNIFLSGDIKNWDLGLELDSSVFQDRS